MFEEMAGSEEEHRASVDDVDAHLNPEQTLNLTDDDMSNLRKLLVEHVS